MDTISAEPDVRPAYQNAHHFLCFSVFQHYVLEFKKKNTCDIFQNRLGAALWKCDRVHTINYTVSSSPLQNDGDVAA